MEERGVWERRKRVRGEMREEEKKVLSSFEGRVGDLMYVDDELKGENSEVKEVVEGKEEEWGKVGGD